MAALRRGWLSELAGPGVLVLLLGMWSLAPGLVRDVLRERAFDLLLPLVVAPHATHPDVAIVDIDHDALARYGPWPWPRSRLAQLVAAAAAARPASLAVDILFAGPDRFSAAALLDTLASESERASIAARLPDLPDGDALLAKSLATAPSALGFALEDDGPGQDLPSTPILLTGRISLPGIWHAAGVAGPVPAIAAVARGFGALVTSADVDGPIRRVPLLVLTGNTLRPGLAVEALRLAQDASALFIDADGRLHVGAVSVPLGSDAELRLV
jgi:adenylate cyclase